MNSEPIFRKTGTVASMRRTDPPMTAHFHLSDHFTTGS